MTRLSEVTANGEYSIHLVEDSSEESIRLKRLGICEGRNLEVLHNGDPMIVRVVGTRVGVSRRLAAKVIVGSTVAVTAVDPVTVGTA